MADILAASAESDPAKQEAATEPVAGLPADLVERMRVDTLAWQAVGGLLIGADASVVPAPCSLLPYPWPADLFAQAQALAVPFNSMVDRVARDTDWLHQATRSVGKTDDFTSRLLALSEAVHETGASQPWQLGIFRSDYMIHQSTPDDAPRLVQVLKLDPPHPPAHPSHINEI
jgi:glutathione synthase